MEQNNLPVPIKNTLPAQVKKTAGKVGKIVGYTVATLGVATLAGAVPVLALPAIGVGVYTAQKLLNETYYKSYKDLAFITRKSGKNIKIFQDILRPDILSQMRGLKNIEKLGFMQMQAIVGMSKFDGRDKQGNPITLETDTHGIVRKTFQTLQRLGYIDHYEETFLKDRRLVGPKLALGNTKDLAEKVPIYNLKFQRTDKPIDFEDEQIRRAFPAKKVS